MRIIYNNLIPIDGFVALNLFGVLFIRRKYRNRINKNYEYKTRILNHENIHTAQMKETLYIGFYIMYFIYYLILLLYYRNASKAYRKIPFEQEAYNNEPDIDYLGKRKKYAFFKYGLWRKLK